MMSLEFCGTSDDVFLVSSNCFISCIVTSSSLILSLCICNSSKCTPLSFTVFCSSSVCEVLSTTVVCCDFTSIMTELMFCSNCACKKDTTYVLEVILALLF